MPQASKTAKKPDILVIWGDDIGISNLSCYSQGLMGFARPRQIATMIAPATAISGNGIPRRSQEARFRTRGPKT